AGGVVDRNVSLICARGTPAARAAKGATTTIPIVMVFVADPVRSGLVTSLSRPGVHLTGMACAGRDPITKELESLKEVVPHASTVGILFDPLNPAQVEELTQEVAAAAAILAVKTHAFKVAPSTRLDAVFAEVLRKRVEALLIYPLALAGGYREV